MFCYIMGNLMKDIKQVYHEQFDGALKEYNAKQTREDRKIFPGICTEGNV